jgi:hypothetical protein
MLHFNPTLAEIEGKQFFSEEQNQKTLIPRPVARYGTWPAALTRA